MEKLKSSEMFENLKPSEEQKKKIYEKIMLRNSEEENREIRIVSDNRFSMKNILYPAAVLAAVTIAVVSSFYSSGRDEAVNTVPAGIPEISDMQTPVSIFDSDAEYTAVVYRGSVPEMKTPDGIYRTEKKYTAGNDLTAVSTDGSEWIKPGNINGIDAEYIKDISVFGDNIYITGVNDSPFIKFLYRTDSEFRSSRLICTGCITGYCELDGVLYVLMYEDTEGSGNGNYILKQYSEDGSEAGYAVRKADFSGYDLSLTDITDVSLTVTDDGEIAEICSREKKIYIYDSDMNPADTIGFPEDDLYGTYFGSSGKIISTDMKNNVKVYSLAEGELICENTVSFENSVIVKSSMGNKYDLIYFNRKTNDYCGYDAVNNTSEYLFRPKKGAGSYAGCFSADGKTYELFTPSNENYGYWNISADADGSAGKSFKITEKNSGGVRKLEVAAEAGFAQETRIISFQSDWEIEDIFVTSDNRIMLSIYTGYSESEYFLKELDTAAMELKDVRCTNRAFLRSAMKQTGTGKYEVFYADDRGIYGTENISRAGSGEMILDFRKVNFDFDYTDYEIRSAYEIRNFITGFSVSDSGEIWLETSKNIDFKLEKR